jgi:hypothetical protein
MMAETSGGDQKLGLYRDLTPYLRQYSAINPNMLTRNMAAIHRCQHGNDTGHHLWPLCAR